MQKYLIDRKILTSQVLKIIQG